MSVVGVFFWWGFNELLMIYVRIIGVLLVCFVNMCVGDVRMYVGE